MYRQGFYIILFVAFSYPCLGATKKNKFLPAHLQKAYVIQKDAIVYARADFDALRIITIPAGTKVTVSRKLYLPKNNFGSFYRIYIAKPKKMKAYISEVDVVPHYLRSKSGYRVNPAFHQVGKKLHQVQQWEDGKDATSFETAETQFSDKPLFQMRWIGAVADYAWISYSGQTTSAPAWFFSMRLIGPGPPVKQIATNMSLGFAVTPPVVNREQAQNGFVTIGDFLLRMPFVTASHVLLSINGALMVKINVPTLPRPWQLQLGAGVVGSVDAIIRIQNRLYAFLEGKYYYDFQEDRSFPSLGAGFLVGF